MKRIIARYVTMSFLMIPAWAQQYTISTIAGGVGPATPVAAANASIGSGRGVATDAAGNVYFTSSIHCVFKIDPAGTMTRVAGTCRPGFSGDGGPATSAQLNFPGGLAVNGAGDIFIADRDNHRLRKVAANGVSSTIAGTGTPGFAGDGGPAVNAQLASPSAVALDSAGNVYIADSVNNAIRKITPAGVISTVAGTGIPGFAGDGGPATSAQLNLPLGVAVDSAGAIYIADFGNNRIRKVVGAVISTLAGNGLLGNSGDGGLATNAQVGHPTAVSVDPLGNVFLATNFSVRKISGNVITNVAGNGTAGFSGDGGPAAAAQVNIPNAVAVDSAGNLFFSDSNNFRIRKVSPGGIVTTLAGNSNQNFSGDGAAAASAQISLPSGVAVDASNNIYVADFGNNRIRKISPGGTISTLAGNGLLANSGDGGPATSAAVMRPLGVALDAVGNVYFTTNFGVRKVAPSGIISTAAGNGIPGFLGDGGPATSAQLNGPQGLAIDSAGNIFVADSGNSRVRRIASNGSISTVGGNGSPGFSGDGGPATGAQLASPTAVAADPGGNVFIADFGNHRIRKISSNGIITTVAGNGTPGFSGDGGPATVAQLNNPIGVSLDPAGNLYIADLANNRIRKVSPGGIISTVAGNGTAGFSGDGGPATSAQIDAPTAATASPTGSILVADSNSNAIRLLQVVVNPSQPLLSITKAHSGNFTQGQSGATYTIVVSNTAGAAATSGLVTVTETIPGGLTLASMAGTGWTCSANTCTRNDVLPGGSSYPPITVTVNVALNAPSQVTNQAGVSGGGSASANAGDITAIQAAIIPPPLGSVGLRFVPVTPCRIADTRSPDGPFGGPALGASSSRDFSVPASVCGIPANAVAYSLNLTVVPLGPLGFVSIWPAGQPQPVVSTLNSTDGRIKANAAIVPAGINGAITVFASNPTQVIVDINGYFVPASGAANLAFYPVTPCRIADTRLGTGTFSGPALAPSQPRSFPITSSSCGIPATAQAFALNMTVVPSGPLGFLSTWPAGSPQPVVSTLNAPTGAVTANAAVVPAGAGGAITVIATNSTHLIIDITGYFAPPGAAGALQFFTVNPCRIADTRNPAGPFGGPELPAAAQRNFVVPASACNVPATAKAFSLNATVVPPGPLGFLTLWGGASMPTVSTLNSGDGTIVANAAIVPASPGGAVSAFASNPTQMILDINGYFAQ